MADLGGDSEMGYGQSRPAWGKAVMAFTIRGFLERCATRRVVLAALAGAVACVASLLWRQKRLGGLPLLDGRGWYTPEEAAALFEALDRLDAQARTVYAATGLTIDMAFPAAYGLLLALPLFRLFRAPFFRKRAFCDVPIFG